MRALIKVILSSPMTVRSRLCLSRSVKHERAIALAKESLARIAMVNENFERALGKEALLHFESSVMTVVHCTYRNCFCVFTWRLVMSAVH